MAAAKLKNKTVMKRLSASVSELLGGRRSKEVELDEAMGSLQHAILIGNTQLLRLLLQNPALNLQSTDSKGCGPLHWAASGGSGAGVVELLLQSQLDPEAPDQDGNTPLHAAARAGNDEAMSALLSEAGSVAILNHDLKTPFDVAAEFGRMRMLSELVNRDSGFLSPCSIGAPLDCFRPGTSGLHLAARNGRVDVIDFLLAKGMDVNESTESGTALHEAARHCQLPAARLLLFMGADPEARNGAGQRPSDLLKKYSGKLLSVARDVNTLLRMSEGSCYAESIVAHFGSTQEELSFPAGATIWVLEQEGRKKHKSGSGEGGSGTWTGVILGPRGLTRTGQFPPTAIKLTSNGRGTMQRGRTAKKVALPSVPPTPMSTPAMPRPTNTAPPTAPNAQLPPPSITIRIAGLGHFPTIQGSSGWAEEATAENPDLKVCLQEAKALSSGHAGMLAAVRSPRHRASTGSNYSHSSSSGFESLKSSGAGTGSGGSGGSRLEKAPSPRHSQSRQSLHSGSSSSGAGSLGSGLSLERLDESGYASQLNIAEMLTSGVPDADVVGAWLTELRLDEYLPLFLDAGYDLPSLARMTPEDLTAIGISRPPHRKRLTNEIHRLNLGDPWPALEPPGGLPAWLAALNLPQEYGTIFQKEGFHSLAQVKNLCWEDFADFGISKLGHLKRLELGIKKLKSGGNGVRCTAEVRPYAHLPPSSSHYQTPQLAPGYRAPSPALSTFHQTSLNSRPYSPQLPVRSHHGPGFDTFPRRGAQHGETTLLTHAVVHEQERPVISVRPQPSTLTRRSSIGSEADDIAAAKESHYANFAGLPTSPRIRLNLNSPAHRKPPPPPPPKRSPHPDDPCSDAPTPLFANGAGLDLSQESCLSAAPSLDCIAPPELRTEESMKNLRSLLERRTAPSPLTSTPVHNASEENLPFANDNCGTIRSRHSPDGLRPTVLPKEKRNGEVLNDIGDMLQNLTDELDALLVPT